MGKTLEQWVSKIQQTQLPVLAQTIAKLGEVLAQDHSSIASISQIIHSDPNLTLLVFRDLRSLTDKALATDMPTLAQCISLVGLERLQTLIAGLPQVPVHDTSLRADAFRRLARRSLLAAHLMRSWAELRNDPAAGELFLITLLNASGEATLWAAGAEVDLLRVERSMQVPGVAPDQAEREILGFRTAELMERLAELWGLPLVLMGAARDAGTQQHVQNFGVKLANRLAQTVSWGWNHPQAASHMGSVAFYVHRPLDEIIAKVHQTAAQAARYGIDCGVPAAAAALPLMLPPAMTPDQTEGEEPASAPTLLAQTPDRESAGRGAPLKPKLKPIEDDSEHNPENNPARQVERRLIPDPVLYSQVMRSLQTDTPSSTRKTIEQTLIGLHQGLGLNRACLATLVSGGQGLRFAYKITWEDDRHLDNVAIPLHQPNLFAHILGKPQSLWAQEKKPTRAWSHVPDAFRDQIGVEEFFVMSVFVRDKPLGLFYADRYSGHSSLDEQSYEQFRVLCKQAIQALNRLHPKPLRPGSQVLN